MSVTEEEYVLMYKSVLRDKDKSWIVAIKRKLADRFEVDQGHNFLHGYCVKGVSTLFIINTLFWYFRHFLFICVSKFR